MLNKVILMGRLTRDPEFRQTPSGVAVCRFSIAINRQFTTGTAQTPKREERRSLKSTSTVAVQTSPAPTRFFTNS